MQFPTSTQITYLLTGVIIVYFTWDLLWPFEDDEQE